MKRESVVAGGWCLYMKTGGSPFIVNMDGLHIGVQLGELIRDRLTKLDLPTFEAQEQDAERYHSGQYRGERKRDSNWSVTHLYYINDSTPKLVRKILRGKTLTPQGQLGGREEVGCRGSHRSWTY